MAHRNRARCLFKNDEIEMIKEVHFLKGYPTPATLALNASRLR